jgi:Flp pilus assembly protein TadG
MLSRSRQGHRSRGQALAEMAVLLPVFLFMLLIAVDFGRLFATEIAVTNAAREGAYYAVQHCGIAGWSAAQAQAAAYREAPSPPATATVSGCTSPVTVTVSEPFVFWTPFLSNGLGPLWGGFGILTIGSSASGDPL